MSHHPSRGQSLMEYAMLIILVAVAVIVILALFGVDLGNLFSNIIVNI